MGSELNTPNDQENTSIDASTIADYLDSHPHFFQQHPDVFEKVQLSHNAGTASLIERQVNVLRENNRDLKEQLNGLIRTARSNEQIINRLQRFTLELMRADGIDDVIATCQEILREDFNSDFVTLKIINNENSLHCVSPTDQKLQHFSALFENKTPVCGRLSKEQQTFLFSENADLVKSSALVPLQGTENLGILALGSQDESRFHPGMGIVFINHLGELISTSISYHSQS